MIPGRGTAVVSGLTVVTLTSVALGRAFLVVGVWIGGTAMGWRVVLVAVWAVVVLVMEAVREAGVIRDECGADVAGTDGSVTPGGSGPTEVHRA